MIETDWIIITGAPCSGKSKVLERLSFLGYNAYPEVSRILLDNLNSNGLNVEEYLVNKERFEKDILDLKLELEERTRDEQLYFFDRGIIDSFAFMKFYDVQIPNYENYLTYKYKKVFFLESVPYAHDEHRFENQKQGEQIANELKTLYSKYNYPLFNVPLMSIENRVELIIKNI